jgi:hypothetical protein
MALSLNVDTTRRRNHAPNLRPAAPSVAIDGACVISRRRWNRPDDIFGRWSAASGRALFELTRPEAGFHLI